jgi:bifunctional non-homologous end joining protein LigD
MTGEAGSAPSELRPMLATLAPGLPNGDGWAFEMKWDGVRAFAVVEHGGLRLLSRNGNDVTVAYPEVRALADQVGSMGAMLDGEIVAVDDAGRASFQLLQSRMHLRDPVAIDRIARTVPVALVVFDVVWLDGSLVIDLSYRRRRGLLDDLALRGPAWQTPSHGFDGEAAFATSLELGFEGVVAKRLDSPYEPGRRSSSWRKIKHQLRQEFVVGGWVVGQGGRADRIGALLVGYFDTGGELRYAGKVGTGFSDAELARLRDALSAIETPHNPFTDGGLPRDARFVAPRLVAEVRFTEWTDRGRIRHPAYLGLRDDKQPEAVVRE